MATTSYLSDLPPQPYSSTAYSHEPCSPKCILIASDGSGSENGHVWTCPPPDYQVSRMVLPLTSDSSGLDGVVGPFGVGEYRAGSIVASSDFGVSGADSENKNRGTGNQPQAARLPGKAGSSMRGLKYFPSNPDPEEVGDRRQDVGSASGDSLYRSSSGRLPPAYGDVIRE
ncbi:hypothetical protein L218DRAFT_188120 [Marasmius fiardii PR-910]|nr:hypothetical protein L218DRAFT_188120 [Marasmius fiardii PR-910]